MQLASQTFWTPKAGNKPEEYEDAFWPDEEPVNRSLDRFRCAIADGATQTSFSKLWAQLLVRAYCKSRIRPLGEIQKSLEPLQKSWHGQMKVASLPWFAQEKVRQGAFSTLLGVTFAKSDDPASGHWEATAIGDSCMFQIRNNEPVLAFPLTHSEQFGNSPALLSTNPISNAQIDMHVVMQKGEWFSGDVFLLMTDALSAWFLAQVEEDNDPLAELSAIESQSSFAELIEDIRTRNTKDGRKAMRNDDVTLSRIAIY